MKEVRGVITDHSRFNHISVVGKVKKETCNLIQYVIWSPIVDQSADIITRIRGRVFDKYISDKYNR